MGERELRDRHAGLIAQLDRVDINPPPSAVAILAQTAVIAAYPGTSTNVYFGMKQVYPGGTESEGAAAANSVDSGTFYALNIGTGSPPLGAQVITEPINGRWIFQYDS